MNFRDSLAFLVPEGSDPALIAILSRKSATPNEADHPPVGVMLGRNYTTSFLLRSRTWKKHRHAVEAIYTNVFRFRVLPSGARYPRALLPELVRPGVRELYRAKAKRSTFKQRVSSTLVKFVPVHLVRAASEPMIVGVQDESGVLSSLRSHVDDASLGCLLGNESSPDRTVVLAFGHRGLDVVAKIVTSAEGSVRLRNEAVMLDRLMGVGRLAPTVPQLLDTPLLGLGYAIVMSAVDGQLCEMTLTPPVDKWLKLCVEQTIVTAGETGLARSVLSESEGDAQAHNIASRAVSHLTDAPVNLAITHGDFAPWNIRMSGSDIRVFDWEFGRFDGLPEWDRMHYIAQVGLLVDNLDVAHLVERLASEVRQGSTHYVTPAKMCSVVILMLVSLARRYRAENDIAHSLAVIECAEALAQVFLA